MMVNDCGMVPVDGMVCALTTNHAIDWDRISQKMMTLSCLFFTNASEHSKPTIQCLTSNGKSFISVMVGIISVHSLIQLA